MSNTINNSDLLGAVENAINAAEVQAESFRSLRDLINEKLEEGGASEAAAFEVTLNGVTQTVISEADDALNIRVRPTDEVQIRKVNSATAGC